MPVIYTIHPDKDERSKIRHILDGRDFLILECENAKDAENAFAKKRADVCLVPLDILIQDNHAFLNMLQETAADCPVILLADKNQITDAVNMVGKNGIYDYFLMHPILDPIRLHVMIDKALTQTGIQLNMCDLKRRLSALPVNFPRILEEQTGELKREISSRITNFKDRMKGEEFANIVHMHFLNEDAFDDKFDNFQNNEIGAVIDNSQETMSKILAKRLTDFTIHIQDQIDNPIRYEDMQALRKKLALSDEYISDSNGKTNENTSRIVAGISTYKSTILFIDDYNNPSSHIPEIIENLGHRILVAQSPLRLLELLKSDNIDLVICGYNLGKLNGIELTRRIKEGLGKTALPILLMTASPTDEIMIQSNDAGISNVLKLPLMPDSLIENIESCLHLK